MLKFFNFLCLIFICASVYAGRSGHIDIGTYYGFKNSCFYKGTTYTLPQFDNLFFEYFDIDLGYLQASKENINSFYVCSISLNLQCILKKTFFKDSSSDLTSKTKKILKLNNVNTSWLVIEPGIFIAYDFIDKESEAGVRIDLINLKF